MAALVEQPENLVADRYQIEAALADPGRGGEVVTPPSPVV